ncbi:MAG: chemotaxis protein CheW, partial [Bryobacterales bacterium]|nr:chemotaxis protein CheW [Bryobacterales bacterium]
AEAETWAAPTPVEQAALLPALADSQTAAFEFEGTAHAVFQPEPAAEAETWAAPTPVEQAALLPALADSQTAAFEFEATAHAVFQPEPAAEAETWAAPTPAEQAALLPALADSQTAAFKFEDTAHAGFQPEPAAEAETWAAPTLAEPTVEFEAAPGEEALASAEDEQALLLAALLDSQTEQPAQAETPVAVPDVPAPGMLAEPEAVTVPAVEHEEAQELGAELEWEEMAEPAAAAQAAPTNAAAVQDDLASVVARLEASLPVAAPWDAGAEDLLPRTEQLRHLVFSINDERFGVRLENLLEVDNMPMWTGIPGMPHTVRGLINLRGEIVSLLDLRGILGLPHPETPKRGKIFVAATSDRQSMSAFAVDEVDGISAFPSNQLKPVPTLTQNETSRYIAATVEEGERLVRILDVAAILTEFEQLFSLDMLRM